MTLKVDLTVNGVPRSVQVEDHWTLLDLLRDALGLKGTKYGCGEGVCGTCTVLLDGRPVRACLFLAGHASGHQVTTVEALAGDDQLDPLQRAFVDFGASQCGYCTPGMLMMAKALLLENPHPTREQVREALAGNICRCTGYTKIVDAVMAAAGGE